MRCASPCRGSSHTEMGEKPLNTNRTDRDLCSSPITPDDCSTLDISNCLFERVNGLIQGDTVNFYNTTFFGGTAPFRVRNTAPYSFSNNRPASSVGCSNPDGRFDINEPLGAFDFEGDAVGFGVGKVTAVSTLVRSTFDV